MENANSFESNSVEEKIARLIRSQIYLQKQVIEKNEFNFVEYLNSLLNSVTPNFLVQMLHTKYEGPNFTIQNVAISIMEIIIDKNPSLLTQFSNFSSELVPLIFLENNFHEAIFNIVVAIHAVGGGSESFLQTLFLNTLEYVRVSSSQNSFIAFKGLIEIACTLNSKLSLSPLHSNQLRDLLAQGLRSSARETIRDNFIVATMVFFAHLDPGWTITGSPSQDNKFVMFVVSLICGEYRLHLQELTTAATEKSEMSSSQDHTLIDQRIQHSINLICICSEIFDIIFSFLLGEALNEDTVGCWESLSSGTLQLIQREITQSIDLFFQSLRYFKKTNQDLRVVITRGMMSFAPWIREDESLHSLFVDSYEEIIQYSTIPILEYNVPTSQHSNEMKEQILAILFHTSTQDQHQHQHQPQHHHAMVDNSSSEGRCIGGVGHILLFRSNFTTSQSSQTFQIIHLNETFVDPFLSTLDVVLTIFNFEVLSDRLSSVAICGVPYLHSILVSLISNIRLILNHSNEEKKRTTSSSENRLEFQQNLSLCSLISEYLLILLTSSRNQMMESLKIVAISSDLTTGEYLHVSATAWKNLHLELTLLLQIRNGDGKRSSSSPLREWRAEDQQNVRERLASLGEILHTIFFT